MPIPREESDRRLGAILSQQGRIDELTRRTRVVVQPPAEAVLVRDIRLPLAAEENLAEVLGFEMTRYTPFRAEDVYFGFRVLERHTSQKVLVVRLLATPRGQLDPLLGRLASLALTPVHELAQAKQRIGLVFLPEGYRQRVRGRGTGLLLALNACALAAVLAVPVIRQGQTLHELDTRLAAARMRAEQVRVLEEELAALRTERELLASRARQAPPAVTTLEELARVLPDGSWLQRLEFGGTSIYLRGQSDAAAALIARIQQSPMFSSPRFVSTVVGDPSTGTERFDIGAEFGTGAAAPGAGVGSSMGVLPGSDADG